MIRIKETFPDPYSVVIQVDGRLDKETLEPLKRVFSRYVDSHRKIVFSLHGLKSISKEGCYFLELICGQVSFVGLSEFLKLELINEIRTGAC